MKTLSIATLAGLALTACSSLPSDVAQEGLAHSIDPMTMNEIREGYVRNATLAQLYRWYLPYENAASPIENSLDILDQKVSIKSGNLEANGHEEYQARVASIPSEWQNAHEVKSTEIEVIGDGSILLTANVTYLNRGRLPDGALRSADLTYKISLRSNDTLLPKLESISIEQNSEGGSDSYASRYAENRIKSLMHYWLSIIEDPSRNPEPAREILAEDFALNFSSGTIDTFDEFKAWLAGPGSSVEASTHGVTAFEHEVLGDGEFRMQAEFEWQGIVPDGSVLIAKTLHSWRIVDDPAERFARIQQVDVEILVPFQPRPGQ